jgi:hypothetical protein
MNDFNLNAPSNNLFMICLFHKNNCIFALHIFRVVTPKEWKNI